MRKSVFVFVSVCFLAVLLTAVSWGQERTAFKVGGANLYSDVFEKFSGAFQDSGKGCKPIIVGSTTGKGITEFINGEIALVAASRAINTKEKEQAAAKGIQVSEKLAGKTSLAVVTGAKNPVKELSLEQVRKIFIGEITNWNEVGGSDEPIRVTMRAVPETGAGVLFQEVVLKGAPHSPKAQVMQSYRTTLTVVGKSNAIGYLPTASSYYEKMADEGVKEIKIRLDESASAVNAPAGLVKDTTFPISIPLVLIWNEKAPASCIPEFVDFVGKTIESTKTAGSKSLSGS
jgi:phosphate transport system substrate-binding protein